MREHDRHVPPHPAHVDFQMSASQFSREVVSDRRNLPLWGPEAAGPGLGSTAWGRGKGKAEQKRLERKPE